MDNNTKLIFPLCSLFLLICVPIKIPLSDSNIDDFNAYLSRYNKTYNETEYQKRLNVFVTSKKMIAELNSKRNNPDSAYYGVTKYSDLLPIEFLVSNLMIKKGEQPKFKDWLEKHKKEIPLKVDWREKDVLSPVYNQKNCGGCWAFTTIETVESLEAIKNGKLDKLSIQQMIDCSTTNNGCKGGDMCTLLDEVVESNLKIVKDIEYPLNYLKSECKINSTKDGVTIKNFKCEFLGNHEDIILHYLANFGPVSAAVNAGSWQHYLGGIIQYHCDSSPFLMNHAVQIVGYDISGSIPFYIVRNSWGTDFGENGYLKIVMGKNMCGIANKVVSISI
ncbi:cathepsin O-like [Onthophagus taurus]|uniref:cathepsin O-like n=1 Tax=Onthophagus taurus TaxID=166361 RepID=UPI000C20CF85|nr:cathepsin O-like [Onthophagus taurus]